MINNKRVLRKNSINNLTQNIAIETLTVSKL